MKNDIFLSEKVNSYPPSPFPYPGAPESPLEDISESAALFDAFDATTGEYYSIFRKKNGEILINENPENFLARERKKNLKLKIKSRKNMLRTRTKKNKVPKVCYCMRARAKIYETGKDGITRSVTVQAHVRYNQEKNRAYYGGLMRCASLWLCPVCRAKILYARAQEIQKAVDQALSGGSDCLMLTYTFRHKKHEPLKQNLDKFMHCLRNFKASKSYKTTLSSLGFFGAIRGLELTWSEKNGFHPHTHELLFFNRNLSEIDLQPMLSKIRILWAKYCKKYGLGAPAWKIGVQLSYKKEKDKAGAYLSKWSLSQELSSIAKEARPGSLTPFDLLDLSQDPDDEYGQLFREYAQAVYGRAQLYWSRGLKDKLLVSDQTDQEIVDLDPKDSIPVFVFENHTWKAIINNKVDIMADILESYESGGEQALVNLLKQYAIPY